MEGKVKMSGHPDPECVPAAKKAKRSCKWQPDWKICHRTGSKKGASYVHCNICGCDFVVASGDIHEVKHRAESKKQRTSSWYDKLIHICCHN